MASTQNEYSDQPDRLSPSSDSIIKQCSQCHLNEIIGEVNRHSRLFFVLYFCKTKFIVVLRGHIIFTHLSSVIKLF